MPERFVCEDCDLEIWLGWFQYHDISGGFGGEAFIVCAECGTCHRLRVAIPPEVRQSHVEAQKLYDVVMVDPGTEPVKVMGAIRRLTGCNLRRAQQLIHSCPVALYEAVHKDEAGRVKSDLDSVGASVITRLVSEPSADTTIPQVQHDLLARRGPCSEPDWENEEWIPCAIRGERMGPAGEFDLAAQACHHCGATGSLVSKLTDPPVRCLRCRKDRLVRREGWVT